MYRTATALFSFTRPSNLLKAFTTRQINMKSYSSQPYFHQSNNIIVEIPSIKEIKEDPALANSFSLLEFPPHEEPNDKDYAFSLHQTLAVACARLERFKRQYPIEQFSKDSLEDIDFVLDFLNLNIFKEKTDLAGSLKSDVLPYLAEMKKFLEIKVKPDMRNENKSYCTSLIEKLQNMINTCHTKREWHSEQHTPAC